MIKSDLVSKAREFAEEKHKGQVRKDGSPYADHLFRVADIVFRFKKCTRAEELIAATFLHDILEDTDTGVNELREEFGEIITLLVVELTTDKLRSDLDGKANYLSSKFASERMISNWALVVKLADRLDNISDLDSMADDVAERKKVETLVILDNLEEKRDLTATHMKLIAAIRERLDEFD